MVEYQKPQLRLNEAAIAWSRADAKHRALHTSRSRIRDLAYARLELQRAAHAYAEESKRILGECFPSAEDAD